MAKTEEKVEKLWRSLNLHLNSRKKARPTDRLGTFTVKKNDWKNSDGLLPRLNNTSKMVLMLHKPTKKWQWSNIKFVLSVYEAPQEESSVLNPDTKTSLKGFAVEQFSPQHRINPITPETARQILNRSQFRAITFIPWCISFVIAEASSRVTAPLSSRLKWGERFQTNVTKTCWSRDTSTYRDTSGQGYSNTTLKRFTKRFSATKGPFITVIQTFQQFLTWGCKTKKSVCSSFIVVEFVLDPEESQRKSCTVMNKYKWY